MRVNHIGYWVECIEREINTFKMLGYKQITEISYDVEKDCYICFLDNFGVRLKLIEPASESLLRHLLDDHEDQCHHICYETTAFERDLLNLQQKGFEIFQKQHFMADDETNQAVFLANNNGAFIELVKAS